MRAEGRGGEERAAGGEAGSASRRVPASRTALIAGRERRVLDARPGRSSRRRRRARPCPAARSAGRSAGTSRNGSASAARVEPRWSRSSRGDAAHLAVDVAGGVPGCERPPGPTPWRSSTPRTSHSDAERGHRLRGTAPVPCRDARDPQHRERRAARAARGSTAPPRTSSTVAEPRRRRSPRSSLDQRAGVRQSISGSNGRFSASRKPMSSTWRRPSGRAGARRRAASTGRSRCDRGRQRPARPPGSTRASSGSRTNAAGLDVLEPVRGRQREHDEHAASTARTGEQAVRPPRRRRGRGPR